MKTKNFLNESLNMKNVTTPDNGSTLARECSIKFYKNLGRVAALLCMMLTLGVGNAWGADHSVNESWDFGTSGNANWSSTNCGSYCGGWGKNKDASPSVYKSNIQNFKDVDFSLHENVSLTIYVKAGTNSGTNSYTVKLLDKDGNVISGAAYTKTKTGGMGSGSNASSAAESSLEFTPTQAFAGYRIEFYPKSFITKTRYVLTYDDKAGGCSSEITITKGSNPANGTFTISNSGTVCIDGGNASTTVTASPSAHYHLATVTSTGGGTIGAISDNTCTVSNISANTTINVTFAADPTYTVTWVAGSNPSFSTQTNYAGTALTNPGTPDPASYCPGGKVFVGWTETPIANETNTIPADLFSSAAATSKTIPVGGTTYYAVFATQGTATFTASDLTNTPATGNTREWGHTASGTLLYLSAGQYYTGGTPYTWTVTSGTSNYARFTAGTGKTITQIVVTISGTNYKINSVTKGSLSTSSTTQTITGINSNTVDCKATSSYQIRITQAVVTYVSAFATSCCNQLAAPTNPGETPTADGAVLTWDAVTGATGYEVKIDDGSWTSTGNGITPGYTITGKACGGTTVSWQVRATGDGSTNCAAGAATSARNFNTTTCACSAYSFHYYHNSAWNAENICFAAVAGATNNYLTDELALPYAENYKVAWQGADQSYTSSTGFSGNMPFFHNRDKKFGVNPQSGNLGGGKGKFHVYHDSGSTNKYISFIPTGYTLNFGTGDSWTNDATLVFAGKTNNWDETEWYTPLTTLTNEQIGKKIFVGLQTASGYVWCDPYSEKANLSGLRTKTGSGDSWLAGGLTTAYANKTGKFRIYADSGDKNWYVTFVPHFQLTYNANGGTETMSPLPATPVSCEETSGNRTVTVATSSFTPPTGKVFDHWNTAADNSGSNVSTGSYTLTGDVTLYAIWRNADYNVTYSAPSNGNYTIKVADGTASSATKTANYGQTITLTATPSSGYQLTSWTIRNTSTSADVTNSVSLSSSSTSPATFTMPDYGVTVTATFEYVYTVTYVHHDKGTFSGASTTQYVPTSSATITLPTVTSVSCGFYDTFEGWIASGSEYSESTSKPATIYEGGSSYTVTGDVTLRAVYSKCMGDGSQTYRKVTAIGDVTNGTYILVSNNSTTPHVYSGHTGTNNYGDIVDGLTADGDDYSTSLPSGAVQVTIARGTETHASHFTIKNGTKYFKAGSDIALQDGESWWQLTTGGNVNSKTCPTGALQPVSADTYVMQEYGGNRFKTYQNTQSYYVFLYKLIDKCTKYYATNPSCVKPVGVHITYDKNANDATMSCSNSNRTYKVVSEVNQYPKLASTYSFCSSATRPGYTLVGWNTQANGLGTTYEIGTNYTNLPVSGELDGENWVTLTVYAMWAPSVSFNVGNATGGTGVPVVLEADGGFMMPEPTAAQLGTIPCGYEFYGWSETTVSATTSKPTLYRPGTKYTGSYRTLYAVYRLAGDANPDLFSLSYMYNSTKYYVAASSNVSTAPSTWTYPYTKGGKFAASTNAEDAIAFGMKTNAEHPEHKEIYWVYEGDESEKIYLQYSSGTSVEFKSQEDTYNQRWAVTGTTTMTFQNYSSSRYLSGDNTEIGCPSSPNTYTFTKEEASTTTYTYATNPDCSSTATLAFVTNGGTLNYPDTYDASNYVDLTVGTTVYLPTATFGGEWVFEGWKKGSEYDSQPEAPTGANFYEVTLNETTYSAAPAGTTTFYAVFSKTVNDNQFDPVNGGTYKLFAIMADGTTKNYMPVWGGNQTTLTPATVCAATGDYTITPGTGEHEGQYKITHGSYTLGVRSDGDTQFKDDANAWWNIEASTSGKGTYRITVVGSSNRCMSFGGTGFFGNYTVNDVSRPSQPGYRDMEIGECIYTEYTSTPENVPYITITGSPVKITSTNGERVYAPTKLHIEAHNFSTTRTIHFSATNGFATNPTSVNTGANGAYSGDIDIYYEPSSAGDGSIVSSVLTASQTGGPAAEHVSQTFSAIRGRNMPANFVIAAKVGEQWYAMPDDKSTTEAVTAVPIEVNDPDAPTAASLVPHNVEWSLSDVVNSNDRPKDKVYFYETNKMKDDGITPWHYALYAGSAPTIGTYGQVSGINGTSSYGYEWGLTTTDLCAYTISNANVGKNISINTSGNFGTHTQNKVSETLYLLPITAYYEPAEFQVVEWKANSVVVMYRGNATKASVQVGGNDEGSNQTLEDVKVDHGVYELAASGLTSATFATLQVVFKNNGGTELQRNYVTIPAIISGNVETSAFESQKDLAESNDVVVLKGGKLTSTGTGTDATSYKFTNVTIYGGGKLDIASDTKFGVTGNLILRAGGVVDGAYDYVYPQLNLAGTLTNSSGNFYYEYVTDYYHWYHLCLPFDAAHNTIKYPTEYYGTAVAANNSGSWIIKRYAGELRATGNYNAWVDIESEDISTVSAGHGYIFWGAPKMVSVGGSAAQRQTWGIQRITMAKAAADAMSTETNNKSVTDLSAHNNVSNISDKPNDQGWNLIGNPYMVNLTGLNSSSIKQGQLVQEKDANNNWTGKWTFSTANNNRYITVPDNHFTTYEAVAVAESGMTLTAGRAFFVQLAADADAVQFDVSKKATLAPMQWSAVAEQAVDIETGIVMSNETLKDEVNFWIKDGKTAEYEFNADYPKTPNQTNFNIYGVHETGNLSWIAIGPEIAEGSMAIGYQVPVAGEYTLSLSEKFSDEQIETLFVTDHGVIPEVTTNLLDENYTFTVNQAETNNERFTVSVKLKKQTDVVTDIGSGGTTEQQAVKFIHNDKMYILRNGLLYDATGKRVNVINK